MKRKYIKTLKKANTLECCCGNIKSDEEFSEDMCYHASLPEDRNGDTRWCRQWLMKDALDLINRQKEEIERLEHIRKGDEQLINSLNKCYKLAKSEAIKEFATKFLKKVHKHHYLLTSHYYGKDYGMIYYRH